MSTTQEYGEPIPRDTFNLWLRAADRVVEQKVGLSIHDLPDVALRSFFDAGMSPAEAASEALAEAGWDEDYDD